MTQFTLGVNNCFAVKRWPEPDVWAAIVKNELGLDLVQHSLDLVDLDGSTDELMAQANDVRTACDDNGLSMDSTFTGLAAYSSNLLLAPSAPARARALAWFKRALQLTAAIGARGTGGHIGAYSVTDFRNPVRRSELEISLSESLEELARFARELGLDYLLIENLATAREPSSMAGIAQLLTDGDESHVPIQLCLDVGHQCVSGSSGDESDPYAWLEQMSPVAPVIQLQQSDAEGDHHWPFTENANALGRIDAHRVLDAISRSGANEVSLVLEIIPTFEADDDEVLADMVASADYWRRALSN
ncbi:MAG TPA: TIM barrel protein [Acidimicrobiales bacterium]|nr:TIM barrel protein [Acidimicrobiales bacterium]